MKTKNEAIAIVNENGENAVVKSANEELKTLLSKVKSSVESVEANSPIPAEIIDCLVEIVRYSRGVFEPYSVSLTPDDRKSMHGYGTRSYGFIEKACASAADNSQFLPSYLSIDEFHNHYGDVYRKRTLLQQVKLYEQQVEDSLISSSDTAYHDALNYYNSLKDAARRNVPDAKELYNELKPYFIRPKHNYGPFFED
ncbi:MAG: hypothetical protein LBF79_01165 [Dysgonamonadaceae bacterium]|jgi:hypothetical protein|nr:hypothetical protein [Dysgonamonadaceae bacterium]